MQSISENSPAVHATPAVPSPNTRCHRCGVMHADDYYPQLDLDLEPTGKWLCGPCIDVVSGDDRRCEMCGSNPYWGESCQCDFDAEVAAYHAGRCEVLP